MIIYCSLIELNCCRNLGKNQVCENVHGIADCQHASISIPVTLGNAPKCTMKRFKVDPISCDGWIVPPVVELWLKNLCHQYNALVDYLDTQRADNQPAVPLVIEQ